MRTLLAHPITAAAFAPYGSILGGACSSGFSGGVLINAGTSEKIALPDPELTRAHGSANLNLYRAKANCLPVIAHELERHCLGSQTFIPLAGVPFVVIVALGDPAHAGKQPLEPTIAAFWLDGSCGVTFNPGTWHHPLLAQREGEFIVLERKAASVDCELKALQEPLQITRPS